MPTTDEQQQQQQSRGVSVDLITRLIKLVGLAVAINATMIHPHASPPQLALAAFMMAGAQGLDTLIDHLLR
jgi:TolB-like protein